MSNDLKAKFKSFNHIDATKLEATNSIEFAKSKLETWQLIKWKHSFMDEICWNQLKGFKFSVPNVADQQEQSNSDFEFYFLPQRRTTVHLKSQIPSHILTSNCFQRITNSIKYSHFQLFSENHKFHHTCKQHASNYFNEMHTQLINQHSIINFHDNADEFYIYRRA